jgi:hypothetical protein
MSPEAYINGVLAEALARGRSRYNARFAAARRAHRRLTAEAFAPVLRDLVAPIVEAVAAQAPDRVDAAADALYDLALDLTGRECLGAGARHKAVNSLWKELLPRTGRLMAVEPARLAGSLTNLVYNLENEAPKRAGDWLQWMTGLIDRPATVDQCLDVGVVLAWRCGLAHFRESALQRLASLPEQWRWAVVADGAGRPPKGVDLAEMWRRDPWFDPLAKSGGEKRLDLVERVGGFRGFGGPFIQPPLAAAADGVIYAFDQEAVFTVHADRFGASVKRFSGRPPKPVRKKAGDFSVSLQGEICSPAGRLKAPVFAAHTSLAAAGETLAATLPQSHYLFLFAPTSQ